MLGVADIKQDPAICSVADMMCCMTKKYIEELTRFSQCLNAMTGFVNF